MLAEPIYAVENPCCDGNNKLLRVVAFGWYHRKLVLSRLPGGQAIQSLLHPIGPYRRGDDANLPAALAQFFKAAHEQAQAGPLDE